MFLLDVCGIPEEITSTLNTVYKILLVAIPVLIIIFGLVDFIKAVTGKKDDEINSGARLFVKRLIIGAIAFFVMAIVRGVASLLVSSGVASASKVVSCITQIFK